MTRAVALLSGGLDSCVAATWAAQRHELWLLHADYGQRTAGRERQAFEAIAHALGVSPERRMQVEVPVLRQVGGSSLTDSALPVEQGEPDPGRIPGTYVPFRNTHLLAAAVSWAEVLAADRVILGCMEQDSSGYPDCRADYIEAFNQLVQRGTRPGSAIQVQAPLMQLDKEGVVKMGLELGAPLQHTWSCYTGERLACGRCESCRFRLRGFDAAGAIESHSVYNVMRVVAVLTSLLAVVGCGSGPALEGTWRAVLTSPGGELPFLLQIDEQGAVIRNGPEVIPLLLAGVSDKAAASATLPDLTAVLAYPTTIFVGRDGRVRSIHSGFEGPGTGQRHEHLVARMEAQIRELLAEPAPPEGSP